ncbi:MAG: hypothetical protein WBH50_12215, partial [Fuerstiella sp.]
NPVYNELIRRSQQSLKVSKSRQPLSIVPTTAGNIIDLAFPANTDNRPDPQVPKNADVLRKPNLRSSSRQSRTATLSAAGELGGA